MATSALEEKINKIRQQNEEIRRRHEEVEEDKKNAAKLNALVQMVPSTDWPERKEPPEFSNLSRANNKPKPAKEHHEHPQQYHSASGEGRKVYAFAQGQGPPPDPKYNFLADAEREESNVENTKDNPLNKGQKHSRGIFRRKPGGKNGMQRDYKMNIQKAKDEYQPEYEAWRAERNRIDEDRISRQRTAEGNWRREWDNDKAHVNEMTRAKAKIGDYVKKDHKDFDKRYHVNGSNYMNYNRSGHRSYRGNSRHSHNNHESRSNNAFHQEGHVKNSLSSGSEERTVVATDKSLKVTLNQGNMTKGPVMSVKVNSPSIAGTGRVGPRQRSRVTYSSHSDVEVTSTDTEAFSRTKLYDDKTKGIYYESSDMRKSQLLPRKKDISNKSPYFRKETRREDINENPQKYETESPRKEYKDLQKSYQFKLQKPEEDTAKLLPNNKVTIANEQESNVISFGESTVNNTEVKENNENNHFNSHIYEKSIYEKRESESELQNSDLLASNIETKVESCEINEKIENKSEKLQMIQTTMIPECKTIKMDMTISSIKIIDDNDRKNIKVMENLSCDNVTEKMKNEEHSSSIEQTREILSNNCDSKQSEDTSEKENCIQHNTKSSLEEKEINKAIILSSTDVCSILEPHNKLESDDKTLREKDILAVHEAVEKINTDDKQNVIKYTIKIQEHTDDDKESNIVNDVVVDKIEFSQEDLLIEEKKAAFLMSKIVETEK